MQASRHITTQTVESYRDGLLQPTELLAAQSHAAGCEECRARLAGALHLDAAFADLYAGLSVHDDDEPEHLSYEQLASLVDGSLDEVMRELAESHLAVCDECAGDADDLRRYQPIALNESAPPLAASARVSRAKPFSAWRHRLAALNFIPSLRSLPTAVAATLIFVALLGLLLAISRKETPDSERAGRMNQAQPKETTQTTAREMKPAESPSASPPPASHAPATEQREQLAAVASTPGRPSQPIRKLAAGTAGPEAQPEAPALRVALDDGGRQVVFDSQGRLRGLEFLPPDAQSVVRRSLATRRVERPRSLVGLAGGEGGVLMSDVTTTGERGGVPFALVGPVGRVVREDAPVLRWLPLAGAVSYRAAIVNSKFQVVAESQPTSATEWTPPSPLVRGQTYYWQVTATLADGSETTSPRSPAPPAKFRVLAQDAADELRRMEQSAPESHLARGVLYARAGLLDEAEDEFGKLVRLNPRSPVARKLLQSVRRK